MKQASFHESLREAQATRVRPWYANSKSAWPQEVQSQSISAYLCPSDGRGGLTNGVTKGVTNRVQGADPNGIQIYLTNYLGIFSGLNDGDTWNEVFNPCVSDPTQRAVFGCNRGSRLAEITDGHYRLSAADSSVVGHNRIEIYAPRKTGKKVPAPMGNPGEMMDETVEAVPDRYNTKSTLQREVKPGHNVFDFELTL